MLFNLDISQLIYFHSKQLLLYHKLLKCKPRYHLQNKMSWHSDMKGFSDKLFSLQLRGKTQEISSSENEAKQNQYEFHSDMFL